ncbi:hypothetical protein FDP22_09545 [Paroceanicella profunda]|uniref:Gamma-glutamylcyclotransferase n=1 Tax=Paroceanicella profunda TaxID=2579971 RepID=A0A5B8FHB5_9RHOB|nr:hypothetical protein [Paroceanicella profunda]QDL91997.1 hypothetical protein FDP22_09545 [Paroceanicella profunda]
MTIAILAYGSLIWDLEVLAPQVRLPWAMGGGPMLPMEFSRISPKRLMGLVLCLDPVHGTECPTHAIVSRRDSLDAAIADLAMRERAPAERIGAVCLRSGCRRTRLPEVAERVADWCAAAGHDAAIWTDLDPNFARTAGAPFSLATAEAWLTGLTGPSRDEAVRYITLAPAASDTALRRHLRSLPWWQAEVARLGLSGPV